MSEIAEDSHLVFLKLGGSLITDKNRPHTPRPEVLARLASEIGAARSKHPGLRLLLGHGSGSFGHVPARQHGTRQGVHTPQEWRGFIEVWREAANLNRLVVDALAGAALPALTFPPSACVLAQDGRVAAWDISTLRDALGAGLLPVVYGDVIFDSVRGGTILSTEELFAYLAVQLRPRRILIAGVEPGVWGDYPVCTRLLPEITPSNFPSLAAALAGSAAPDVTGGMASKVQENLALVEQVHGLEVQIFSGQEPGQVAAVLGGDRAGTIIHSPYGG